MRRWGKEGASQFHWHPHGGRTTKINGFVDVLEKPLRLSLAKGNRM